MKLFERLVEYELENIMKGKRSDKEYKSLDYNKYSVNPVFFQSLKMMMMKTRYMLLTLKFLIVN